MDFTLNFKHGRTLGKCHFIGLHARHRQSAIMYRLILRRNSRERCDDVSVSNVHVANGSGLSHKLVCKDLLNLILRCICRKLSTVCDLIYSVHVNA